MVSGLLARDLFVDNLDVWLGDGRPYRDNYPQTGLGEMTPEKSAMFINAIAGDSTLANVLPHPLRSRLPGGTASSSG
jgi:hypothetical protein